MMTISHSSPLYCHHRPLKHPPPLLLSTPVRTFQVREIRLYKRRRLKSTRRLSVRSDLTFFNDIISQFPSALSVGILAPALGLVSGVAIYLSKFGSLTMKKNCDVGECILFTSPTPFNRFVLLRCPSITTEGGELLEGSDEKLIKEGSHFLKFNCGRMKVKGADDLVENLKYQRVCVSTKDGGVISLDWPANLDMKREYGLDTTLLLVAGSPEGSMDINICSFVCEALRCGFFVIVMNPRGCGRSPLTTARLFTAADSDDVCTAIEFINKERGWTTLMAIGWGYGASMLTKYLAEVGEKTPLTAATCIDNPFDLEEATRSTSRNIGLDQKLIGGRVDILRSNKELFQSKVKGFDVEKALAAKSVCEFDEAISMVSHGFKSIEDFYSKCSTREVVGSVRIPVLFVQNNDGTPSIFSIPRAAISESPFTTLLLCSCFSSNAAGSDRAAVSWCQRITTEWLAAVELGLLKGRHPLLKDIDLTLNPSKGLSLAKEEAFDKGGQFSKLLDVSLSRTPNANTGNAVKEVLEVGDIASNLSLKYRRDTGRNSGFEIRSVQKADKYALRQTEFIEGELVKGEETSPADSERGQVLQTTHVVMNMLDATLPGTLTEERKKKVLAAVDQGETVMKALQDAVPEDVRGKLTTAVSGILHTQSTNLKFDRLKSREALSADQTRKIDKSPDSPESNLSATEKSVGHAELDFQPAENLPKHANMGQLQGDASNSARKDTDERGRVHEAHESIKEKESSQFDTSVKGPAASIISNSSSDTEKEILTEESVVDEHKAENIVAAPSDTNRENNVEEIIDTTSEMKEPNKTANSTMEGDVSLIGLSSDAHVQPSKEEVDVNQKNDSESSQPVLDQSRSSDFNTRSPTFSVSQAFEALTGMDDSTQVAVNSVFGVIENMISQLQDSGDENKSRGKNGLSMEMNDSASDKLAVSHDRQFGTTEEKIIDPSVDSDNSCNVVEDDSASLDSNDVESGGENELAQNPISSTGKGFLSSPGISKDNISDEANHNLVNSKLFGYSDGNLKNVPLYIIGRTFGDAFLSENSHKYPLSKLPKKKLLDLDTTAALLFDYFPEEGQWMLLEQPGNFVHSSSNDVNLKSVDDNTQIDLHSKVSDLDDYIEPPYVVLDTGDRQEPVENYEKMDEYQREELVQFVKSIIMDSLKSEVDRKLCAANMKGMEPSLSSDLLEVANAASLAVKFDLDHITCTSEKVCSLHGDKIIRAISSAVQDTGYLRKVLPAGVIVGSSLAALRKHFNVTTSQYRSQISLDQTNGYQRRWLNEGNAKQADKTCVESNKITTTVEKTNDTGLDRSIVREQKEFRVKNLSGDSAMVGAVTAAIGASAFLARQNPCNDEETVVSSVNYSKVRRIPHIELVKHDETSDDDKNQNIIASLAEKSMSVAGPVMPTKKDGEIDQERLVAMLADLRQSGGILKLVGKLALLWGGIRGAVSLTDRLISFLHIADRPLLQRILGFAGMVMVLWSPVVIPLLPTIVQTWTSNQPSRFVEFACIIGLYVAVVILIMLWGKRIRGYEDPFRQYGLDLTSNTKIQNLLKGFIGGVALVFTIQTVYALLGRATFHWPSALPSSTSDAVAWLKASSQLLMLVVRGTLVATSVALVEELLFRSWLTEEIATDLGYQRAIILSGLAFSLFQRSIWSIPGLWVFSFALSVIQKKSEGSLSVPIGLRAGIVATTYILQLGGFVTYKTNFPVWVSGSSAFEPFGGAVGLAFSTLMVLILYPRRHQQVVKNSRF